MLSLEARLPREAPYATRQAIPVEVQEVLTPRALRIGSPTLVGTARNKEVEDRVAVSQVVLMALP